jgi:Xaa-Pro aminopeptidase
VDFHLQRRTQLQVSAKENDVDAVLVTHPANVRYLCEFPTAEAVLVSGKGSFVLFADDVVPARKHLPDDVTPVPRAEGADATAVAVDLIRAAGAKTVAVDAERTSVAALHRLEAAAGKTAVRPLGGLVERARAVKDPSEVEAVRKAVAVGVRALLMFRAIMRDIDHELDLTRQMDQLLLRAGANSPAFPTQVGLGEHSAANTLRPSTDRPVSEVTKLFVHWGAEVGGYCGTLSRTLRSPFVAPPLRKTKAERTAHDYDQVSEAVKAAMRATVEAIRPGATAADLAKAAHAQLSARGYSKFTAVEIGHGVGLEAREGPALRPADHTPLVPGMVLNVTPQVRIPEWGMVKYSQTVVVNRDGFTDLGGSPTGDD